MKPTLRILHNLARSGGTILSRCLGCMDGVALLSEIHPKQREVFDPIKQAREWYGIEVPETDDFAEAILSIERKLREDGRALVIRGWEHVDYMPCPWNGWRPAMRPALFEVLRGHFELRRVALIRDTQTMWTSLERFLVEAQRLPRSDFDEGYLRYVAMAALQGAMRYEDFLADPPRMMRAMCQWLALPFDPEFVNKWQSYRNVTGDLASFDRTVIGPRLSANTS